LATGAAHANGLLEAREEVRSTIGLRDDLGNPDAARAAYQQAIDTGHPDIAPHAAFNLERLEEGPH